MSSEVPSSSWPWEILWEQDFFKTQVRVDEWWESMMKIHDDPWWHWPVWLLLETKSPYLAPHKTAMECNRDSRNGRQELWDVAAQRPTLHVETFWVENKRGNFCITNLLIKNHEDPREPQTSFSSHFTPSKSSYRFQVSAFLSKCIKFHQHVPRSTWQKTSLTQSLIFLGGDLYVFPWSTMPTRQKPHPILTCAKSDSMELESKERTFGVRPWGWIDVGLTGGDSGKKTWRQKSSKWTYSKCNNIHRTMSRRGFIYLSLPFEAAMATTPLGFPFSCSSTSSDDDSKKTSLNDFKG